MEIILLCILRHFDAFKNIGHHTGLRSLVVADSAVILQFIDSFCLRGRKGGWGGDSPFIVTPAQ